MHGVLRANRFAKRLTFYAQCGNSNTTADRAVSLPPAHCCLNTQLSVVSMLRSAMRGGGVHPIVSHLTRTWGYLPLPEHSAFLRVCFSAAVSQLSSSSPKHPLRVHKNTRQHEQQSDETTPLNDRLGLPPNQVKPLRATYAAKGIGQ